MHTPVIRPARRSDAAALVPLIDRAGEGLPAYFWSGNCADGQDPQAFGQERIESDDAGISWRNAFVAEVGDAIAGCLIAYSKPEKPDPVDNDIPTIFRPLSELEVMAAGTGYVYILSTREEMCGRGIGGLLLRHARRFRGPNGMSLIVADHNVRARALYERHGFAERARRPMVKEGWDSAGEAWVLMINPD